MISVEKAKDLCKVRRMIEVTRIHAPKILVRTLVIDDILIDWLGPHRDNFSTKPLVLISVEEEKSK